MAKSPDRLCRRCGAVIGIDDDRCERCGAENKVTLPWYGPLVGVAIVGLFVWLLVDFSGWERILDRLFNGGRVCRCGCPRTDKPPPSPRPSPARGEGGLRRSR